MDNAQNLTPLMKQYWEIKSLHADKILLFRMGDFFEMFYDDAVKAAPILGIALTSRNKKAQDETPMCGMPHHSIAGPINKLLSYGLKVAICDQIEDPKFAKGIVKRAVTRILTPGMVYDPDTIDATKPHYICAFDDKTVSFLDSTTGEAFYFSCRRVEEIQRYLDLVQVAEYVVGSEQKELFSLKGVVTEHNELYAQDRLPESALRILSYVASLGAGDMLVAIRPFELRSNLSRMDLPPVVLKHLEVFETYQGQVAGSLFHAINRTQTSAGARLLRQWLNFPLQDVTAIQERQNWIQWWYERLIEIKSVRTILSQMGDVERRLTKISQPTCNGRDLQALASSVQSGLQALKIQAQDRHFESLLDLAVEIDRTIVDEPPISTKQGYVIKSGVSPELDELILLSTNSQELVQKMETEEREKTGISSLKIRYNNVFGYYIEITNTHKEKVPSHYLRKQTLANAERYCTDELVELEKKVLSAQVKRNDLESEYFEKLRKRVLSLAPELMQFASACAQVDLCSSLAWVAVEQKYVRPEFSVDQSLSLIASRHPVVEQFVKSQFVANDIELDAHSCMLLTGPNMAGKSTLMRQVALTALMAQIGAFVPADRARLPVFDAIFTRIGASDQLSEGLSTFMVEMVETAALLKKATAQSLVVLDEVGRGTSTFDGMALAQSILEHLLSQTQCLTFFATHYHELTNLEHSFTKIANVHMTVSEKGHEIRFLHTLARGPAAKSYGIHVAQLAGLPSSLTQRAKGILRDMESKRVQATSQLSLMDQVDLESSVNEAMSPQLNELANEIRNINLLSITPLEAMNRISKWQERLF